MSTPVRTWMSRAVGWLADRRIPGPLRTPIYRAYCRFAGADPSEAQLPLHGYSSLGAFFVRRLRPGLRRFPEDELLLGSPVDGRLQDRSVVTDGTVLQAKGQPYSVRELLAGVGEELELEGAVSWTLYLSPRDYHRIHAPESCRIVDVAWQPGAHRSVRPKVLSRREAVLATNERVALALESPRGPFLMVFVGALNVGRLRVVGVGPGQDGPPPTATAFARGDELGRFELGSTVVMIWPRGATQPLDRPAPGDAIRMGSPLARYVEAPSRGAS